MTVKRTIKFIQSLSALALLCLSAYSYSQSAFNLNDPNIVYKDKEGNPMTKDSVMSFISKGNFGMMKKDLGDGKTEIRLVRQTKVETDERAKATKEWISKWIGKPFPNFNLSTLKGNSIKPSDLNGKVVVINFWFTGCQPCIAEMPKLNELVSNFEGQPVVFLAFTFNDKEAIEKFILKRDFKYAQLPNARDLIKELTVDTYPTHMILDKSGIIKEIEIGATEDIYNKLAALINKVAQ